MAGDSEERSQLPHPARSVPAANATVTSIVQLVLRAAGSSVSRHMSVYSLATPTGSDFCSELMSSSSPNGLLITESDGSLLECFRKLSVKWLCT